MDNENIPNSSTTTTCTTYHPDLIKYWQENPRPIPPPPKYVETIGELIEILQKFPKETKFLVHDGYGDGEALTEDGIYLDKTGEDQYLII